MSRHWFATLSLLSVLVLSLFADPAGDAVRYRGSMGYLKDGMQYIREKDMRLALEFWTDELLAREQIKATIRYYDDAQESIDAFAAFKHDMLAVNPYFYLRSEARIDPWVQSYWIFQMGPQTLERAVILVRRDSMIASAADLKGKRVVVRDDNYMGRLFFDREMLEQTHHSYREFVGEMMTVENHSMAVLRTFFNSADACIVPHYVFDVVVEMNPAVGRELTVLAESPEIFVPIMAVFHKRTPPEMLNAYSRFVQELSDTEKGRNILNLFKMQAMHRVPSEVIEPMRRYYREYQALRKRYGAPETISRSTR